MTMRVAVRVRRYQEGIKSGSGPISLIWKGNQLAIEPFLNGYKPLSVSEIEFSQSIDMKKVMNFGKGEKVLSVISLKEGLSKGRYSTGISSARSPVAGQGLPANAVHHGGNPCNFYWDYAVSGCKTVDPADDERDNGFLYPPKGRLRWIGTCPSPPLEAGFASRLVFDAAAALPRAILRLI